MAVQLQQPYFLDEQALDALARSRCEDYRDAEPFPHAVIDDLLPAEVLEQVLAEYPDGDDPVWQRFEHRNSVKLALCDEARMGPASRHLIAQLNSATFLRFLETLTGIDGLLPDPHLEGGGYHRIERSGRLEVHADFDRHSKLRVDRRLNLLVFLNRDWDESYGGHLELWAKDMSRCVERVLPVFGRAVVFSTTDDAFHGHPHPLTCPPDRSRLSLALYYYSAGRPEHEAAPAHSTLYQRRPGAADPRGGWLKQLGRSLRGKR